MKKAPTTKEIKDFLKYIQVELDEIISEKSRFEEWEMKLSSKDSGEIADDELDRMEEAINRHVKKCHKLGALVEQYINTNHLDKDISTALKNLVNTLKEVK